MKNRRCTSADYRLSFSENPSSLGASVVELCRTHQTTTRHQSEMRSVVFKKTRKNKKKNPFEACSLGKFWLMDGCANGCFRQKQITCPHFLFLYKCLLFLYFLWMLTWFCVNYCIFQFFSTFRLASLRLQSDQPQFSLYHQIAKQLNWKRLKQNSCEHSLAS